MNPSPTDQSIEEDITRMRKCRNKIMHMDTLGILEKDFNDKWQELVEILNRLNISAGIGNLSTLINDAKNMDIDEELKQQYLETMKAWVTMDSSMDKIQEEVAEVKRCQSDIQEEVAEVKRGQSDIQEEVAEVKRGQSDIQEEVAEVKRGQSDIQEEVAEVKRAVEMRQHVQQHFDEFKDIQKYLVDFYQRRCKTLPVSPSFKNKDENLSNIYKYPTMYSVKCYGEKTKEKKEIKCYEDIFCKDGRVFEEIYIVGDAGVGKTSFCTYMSCLWDYTKSDNKLEDKYKELQKDVEYMSKFEFVFYVSLRETNHTHVIDMIIEQLFRGDKAKYEISIDTILRDKQTLILMDGLDEWVPTQAACKKIYELPDRIYSKNCVYVTTTRPYRIESVRLSLKDVDHQVEIKGISGESAMSYIEDLIQYMNIENSDNRNLTDFISDMKKCNFDDMLCIPIIVSHLVVLWFEQALTNMPRALIYANILEMLFNRAEKRGVDIPSSTESKFQHLPDSLSGLTYLNKHVSLLYNVCHLSFRSLFKQDELASNLVFTVDQLQDEPYCFTDAETDFLCKIGILSKNEVFGCYTVEKLKISFIHKNYIQFFAALFISSSDISQLFDTKWKLRDVLQSEHLILLLVGFFAERGKVLLDNLYQLMSEDLSLCRRNAIFHYHSHSYQQQIQSLQNVVINCFREVSRSNDPYIVLKLQDFIFGDSSNVDILKQLLLLNTTCVKSIHSVSGKYYDEFDQIQNLQYLHVGDVLSGDYVNFTECMLQNQSTLHTVCIEGGDDILTPTLIPGLPVRKHSCVTSSFRSLFKMQPVRSLQHLTSLSLHGVNMQHNSLHDLVKFLSDNVLLVNIKLSCVSCGDHPRYRGIHCTWTLNLPHHKKLTSLYLEVVDILCNNVNNSSLKSITLSPLSKSIVSCYIDVFNCIKCSQLEHLHIYGSDWYKLDCNTVKILTCAVKTLPYIKSLTLWDMKLPDDVLLQLHPDVTQVQILLGEVTMSCQYFHCIIESFVNNNSVIKIGLDKCKITSVVGETHRVLSLEESVDYMSEYLTSIHSVNITYKDDESLGFETRIRQ